MWVEQIDIKDFARRVEEMCDFYLNLLPNTSSNKTHIKKIQNLKEDAANIQFKVLQFK
jgi:hypothetical protein